MLAGFAPELAQKLLDHLRDIAKQNLLTFVRPGAAPSLKYAAPVPDAIAEGFDSRVVPMGGAEPRPLVQLAAGCAHGVSGR